MSGANWPVENGAYSGRLKCEDNKKKWKEIANEGARTILPREHDENTDVKNISRWFSWFTCEISCLSINNPIIQPGPVEPRYSNYLTLRGISVDETNEQYFLDATLVYRQACLSAIRYLTHFSYTEEQAYCLLVAAPIEGRIVNIPNSCCTLSLPTDIFPFIIISENIILKKIHFFCFLLFSSVTIM